MWHKREKKKCHTAIRAAKCFPSLKKKTVTMSRRNKQAVTRCQQGSHARIMRAFAWQPMKIISRFFMFWNMSCISNWSVSKSVSYFCLLRGLFASLFVWPRIFYYSSWSVPVATTIFPSDVQKHWRPSISPLAQQPSIVTRLESGRQLSLCAPHISSNIIHLLWSA